MSAENMDNFKAQSEPVNLDAFAARVRAKTTSPEELETFERWLARVKARLAAAE